MNERIRSSPIRRNRGRTSGRSGRLALAPAILKTWLGQAANRADAERKPFHIKVNRARAFPTIIQAPASRAKSKDQEQAVRPGPISRTRRSSRELSPSWLSSRATSSRSVGRSRPSKGDDRRDYAEPLVKMIHRPWTSFRSVRGRVAEPADLGESTRPEFHPDPRTYDAPAPLRARASELPGAHVGIDPTACRSSSTVGDLANTQQAEGRRKPLRPARGQDTADMIALAQFKAESSRMQMISDINDIRIPQRPAAR